MTGDHQRPHWHEIWMAMAHEIAKRSYDPRLKVGTVIVAEDNSTVLAIGYNGQYSGGSNEPDSLEEGKSGFIHSEANALLRCDFHFPKKKVMYVTHFPCLMCAKYCVNAGINRVVYGDVYRDMSGISVFNNARLPAQTIEDALKFDLLKKKIQHSGIFAGRGYPEILEDLGLETTYDDCGNVEIKIKS